MKTHTFPAALVLLLSSFGATAFQQPSGDPDIPSHQEWVKATKAIQPAEAPELQDILPVLAEKRVVFVGETHERYDHHLNQLAIIQGLHRRDPNIAIGVEFIQQPFQHFLDQYIAGQLDESELLRKTEYYDRWGYDYRLYAPIFRYAREHGIPLVALNLAKELIEKVSRQGMAGVTPEDKAQLPAVDDSDPAYRERLQRIFEQHPVEAGSAFDRFVEVQLLWDESMADATVDYLQRHPDKQMIVLAGRGHIQFGSGIPQRVQRRLDVSMATVVNGFEGELEPGVADFVLLSPRKTLPPAGSLGLLLKPDNGGLQVEDFTDDSAGRAMGIQQHDAILSLGGQAISDMADVRMAMWDKQPGDEVSVQVRRSRWFKSPVELSFRVTLR